MLVTGSNGFVGSWLLRHLDECGDDVVPLPPEVDITDASHLREVVIATQPDAIVHLAAQADVLASWRDPRGTFAVNAGGTLNLLEAAADCPRPPRVLAVSSAEVYGRVPAEDMPIGEHRPFDPVTPYAASKCAAELLALQAWHGRGLEVIRVRPFNHTGPGQSPAFVVPGLARQVAEAVREGAGSIKVGNLAARRDLSDVRDVVRAYRLLLEVGEPGEVYNVCQGHSVAIAEVAQRLLEAAGAELSLVPDPSRFRPVDVPDVWGDPGRLRTRTGWTPRIDLAQTIADVWEDWQARVSA